ncbi:type IV pilin [Methanocorpusculum parvum]|uniref:Archaeal Type IV pilin N-terminal domain-containing protein n=1 Tax=Methanocorpusculum parvum TaxID=2193 RepID=A0AAX0Q6S0_9EURY|nr:type IV pilin [Methanocorpusculum parvum]PAV08930.1 hypothetical protein ASJ83_01100 [Methanocorpusculum parvum]
MKQRSSNKGDDGVSPVIATLLLIALTLIICAIVFAFCTPFINLLEQPLNKSPPEILAIVSVNHYNTNGEKTYESIVTLKNIGKVSLKNTDYKADIYINDIKQYIVIKTLSAPDFISTNHFGIQLLYGTGPTNYYWDPNQNGIFDLNDRTIHPGDLLRIDIINNNASSPSFSKVISRSIKLIE